MIALVGDLDGAVAQRHRLAVEPCQRRRAHRCAGAVAAAAAELPKQAAALLRRACRSTSWRASHCSNSACSITTMRPVMRE